MEEERVPASCAGSVEKKFLRENEKHNILRNYLECR